MFSTMPIIGIVENMSYLTLPDGSKMDVFGEGGGEAMANHYDVPFLGGIPMNPNVRIGGDSGKPIVITDPESDAAKALIAVAEAIAAKVSISALSGDNSISINIV